MCGHLFEAIDYFWYLNSKGLNTDLLLFELNKEFLVKVLNLHYNFNQNEISFILSKTKFVKNVPLVIDGNILFCDGCIEMLKNVKVLGKLLLFSCGEIFFNPYERIPGIYLEDFRIYKPLNLKNYERYFIPCKTLQNCNNSQTQQTQQTLQSSDPQTCDNPQIYENLQDFKYNPKNIQSINYVKKILFSRLREYKEKANKTLIYCTPDDRKINNFYNDDYLVQDNKFELKTFKDFNKYIYTPTNNKFDCSPRFIKECEYFGIPVQYDIDYFDIGLETRKSDTLEFLELENDNQIIEILKVLEIF